MCVRALFETCEIGFRAIRDRKVLSWECVLGGFSEDSPMLRRVKVLPAALAPLQRESPKGHSPSPPSPLRLPNPPISLLNQWGIGTRLK